MRKNLGAILIAGWVVFLLVALCAFQQQNFQSVNYSGTVTFADGSTATSSGFTFANAFALPSGSTATTPATSDNSTKVITSAWANNYIAALNNQGTATQSVGTGGNTVYVTNSPITVPSAGVQISPATVFTYRMIFSKTAAGTAASSIIIYVGTTGTTSDTAEVTQTLGTETAAADVAWADVIITVNGPLTSSCVAQWSMNIKHNDASGVGLLSNALAVAQGTFTFNATTSGLLFGLGFTSGASDVVTIDQVQANAVNLGG